jgi:ribosomal protein S6
MKYYELTYLLPSELSEEETKKLTQKLVSTLQEEGGELLEEIKPNKKRLGYPIKKQRQAYSGVLDFTISPERLEEFSKKIKSESQVLRFLISTKKLAKAVKERKPRIIVKKIEAKPKIEKSEEERKVELEDIEKKLEEILGKI